MFTETGVHNHRNTQPPKHVFKIEVLKTIKPLRSPFVVLAARLHCSVRGLGACRYETLDVTTTYGGSGSNDREEHAINNRLGAIENRFLQCALKLFHGLDLPKMTRFLFVVCRNSPNQYSPVGVRKSRESTRELALLLLFKTTVPGIFLGLEFNVETFPNAVCYQPAQIAFRGKGLIKRLDLRQHGKRDQRSR
jgi:hypothetical protein